jgi:twitching motility protein PilJ
METSTGAARLVAASAERSAAVAAEALAAARRGDEAVQASRAGMQRIRAEVQVIAKRLKGLGDRSLEISQIVDTIEAIASHTNLLALNAAIEAAGAGEAGLRFTVVADEIRKLAERAAKATRDIAAVIRAVQGETQEAVVAMERGIREVESGYQVTLHAEESLADIARVSRASAQLAEEISTSTRDQAGSAEAVAAAMQSIAAVAVQTEQAGLQTHRAVDDLVKVADELTRLLARFRLATP